MRAGLIVDLALLAANAASALIQGPTTWLVLGNAFVSGLLVASMTDDLIRMGWRRNSKRSPS